ncbi:hypothetical protein GRF59_05865 [Paenibacillus sp. HJL G12]|uniref:Uncharacterized protein n=1 Tax=Paenibacillus dendrobii TaxID=2691084 RepID=A0A7X3IGR4_9BACL|nr:hypothetical protein [Paenibacillus dendrobii]MWV43151.1 hypothetical protein [Paenibacillus dendrobii]
MLNRTNKYNRVVTIVLVFMMCLMMGISGPSYALASDSVWEAALEDIGKLHDTFIGLESANQLEKQQIQDLRKQNNDKLKLINTRVQLIDMVKLDKLKTEAEQVQKKYAPLLAEYSELGRKATEARKRKDSKSALLYDLKRNRLKTSVNNARQEIKGKKDAYLAAKKIASAKAKVVKDILIGVQALKRQITAENQKMAEWNKDRAAADKRYKAAVKAGNAVTTASELKQIVAELNRIHDAQNKIMGWERDVAQTLRSAEAKLPS